MVRDLINEMEYTEKKKKNTKDPLRISKAKKVKILPHNNHNRARSLHEPVLLSREDSKYDNSP
jgi:hypothetical protein